MHSSLSISAALLAALALSGPNLHAAQAPQTIKTVKKPKVDKKAQNFLKAFDLEYGILNQIGSDAYFRSSVDGNAEDSAVYEEYSIKSAKLCSNPEQFKKVEAWHNGKTLKDPIQKRHMELVYLTCKGSQLPDAINNALVMQQSAIQNSYMAHKSILNGQPTDINGLRKILKNSTNDKELEAAWEAALSVSSANMNGKALSDRIIDLVKDRNQAAQLLGYKNYHQMSLALSEQDPNQIEKQFDELDALTRDAYGKVKVEVDAFLAKRLNISQDALRPWHYQDMFFQMAPSVYNVQLDDFYKKMQAEDITGLVSYYYESMGMDVEDIIQASSLYKNTFPSAYCMDVDRAGDVRIICNIVPNHYWMGTLLHEMGHGVYSKFNDCDLPWTLRNPAHAFTTEAVAMLFGRSAFSPAFLRDVVGADENAVAKVKGDILKSQRLEQLVFSRWAQVMFRFEKAMYENPEQDLNALWWNITEKYQGIKRPEGRNKADWAAKIHISTYPAYYHNYLLGELLASQLENYIRTELMEGDTESCFCDMPEVGEYLINNVFEAGARYRWDEMIRRATGESLTAKYYAQQFVN